MSTAPSYYARQAFAVLVFPFTVAVIVPTWLARAFDLRLELPQSMLEWLTAIVGIVVLVVGGTLFVASLRRFGGEGQGTLAPWDPPTNLVIRGPYAFVRNPMISGVFFVLVSESLLLRSWLHLAWAGVFGLLNATYIPLLEEPGLRARFGAAFDEYARNVPRLLPRVTPWRKSEP